MKTHSKLLPALLLLILVNPPLGADEPPENGKLEGLWTHWDENGKKKQETHYKNGEEISRKEFYGAG